MACEQPKKPMTAFFLYIEEKRPEVVKQLGDQAKVKGLVIKTASEQWKGLSADARKPYEEKASAAKAEYDRQLEAFKSYGGTVVRKSKAEKKGKAKKDKDKDAPKKPSGGGYGQYLAQHREEIVKSLPAGSNATTDVAKAAGARWKALSDAEKKPFEETYAEKMKAYQAALEEYKASKPPVQQDEDKAEQKAPAKRARKQTQDEVEQKTPAKRARKGDKTPSPVAPKPPKPAATAGKRGRSAAKAKAPDVPEINGDILAEAQKLGYEAELRNLAARQDVKDLGKPDKDLLEAIKASNGLVNPARRALLGA